MPCALNQNIASLQNASYDYGKSINPNVSLSVANNSVEERELNSSFDYGKLVDPNVSLLVANDYVEEGEFVENSNSGNKLNSTSAIPNFIDALSSNAQKLINKILDQNDSYTKFSKNKYKSFKSISLQSPRNTKSQLA
ncbi:hypothetical protein KFK09_008640 [Dendrobium nobile]|uniref:Uncharacterized protein n=1 Tax=Dendrobium nobile TaxID=94219 RepID=A0A8T3BNA0_DENNO|nr:hypothetical protein KFK09_008640 [Dendrobium nobile]